MAPSSETVARRKRSGARRAFFWIGGTAVVLGLGLTGAWFYAANRLDRAVAEAIAAAAGGGTRIDCPDRTVFGYPFRIGLSCSATGIAVPAKGVEAEAGPLRTAAQLYQPNRVVAELDAPLRLALPNQAPVVADWTLLHASARFWTSGVERFDMEATELALMPVPTAAPAAGNAPAAPPRLAEARQVEAHARRNGADLDMAASGLGLQGPALGGGAAPLPPLDASLDLSVAGAAGWLGGERPGRTLGEALRGRSGTLRSLRIAAGPTPAAGANPAAPDARPSLDVSGPFSVGSDGLVTGRFTLAFAEPQKLGEIASGLPGAGALAGSLASALRIVGRQENGRTVVTLDVKDGRASLGLFPLPPLPPIE